MIKTCPGLDFEVCEGFYVVVVVVQKQEGHSEVRGALKTRKR